VTQSEDSIIMRVMEIQEEKRSSPGVAAPDPKKLGEQRAQESAAQQPVAQA
jgi:hypothetical protein